MSPMENKAAFQALAGLAQNSPLVRLGMKYWWLVIPASVGVYLKAKARPSRSLVTYLEDFGICFGAVVPIVMLSEMVVMAKPAAPAPVPTAPPGSMPMGDVPIKDAQFKLSSAPAPKPFPVK